MPADPAPLELPDDQQEAGGWELVEGSVETLFELPGVRVRGTMRRYEDERTRAALRDATDGAIDHQLRFVATTRLGFEPSLPPGTMPAMLLPTLLPEARRSVADRLRDRGLTDVSREGTERIRGGSRTRIRLTRYRATDPMPGANWELPLECWLAVWPADPVAVVTAGYPATSLASRFDLDTGESSLTRGPNDYRDAFLSLLRALA